MGIKKLGFNILKSKILIKFYDIIEWVLVSVLLVEYLNLCRAISLVSFINKFSAVPAFQAIFPDFVFETPFPEPKIQTTSPSCSPRNSFLRRSTHLVDTSSIYLSPDAPSSASTFHQRVELSADHRTYCSTCEQLFEQTSFAVKFPRTRKILQLLCDFM